MALRTRIGGLLRIDLSAHVSEWGELGGKAAAHVWQLIGAPSGATVVLEVGPAQWADGSTLDALAELLSHITPASLTVEGSRAAGVAQIVADLRQRAAETAESAETQGAGAAGPQQQHETATKTRRGTHGSP